MSRRLCATRPTARSQPSSAEARTKLRSYVTSCYVRRLPSRATRLPRADARGPLIARHSPAGRGCCFGSIFWSVPASSLELPASRFDRYTCRTKNAVSSFSSPKLPNLIDTEFAPAARRPLHVTSRYVPRAEHRGAKDLAASPLLRHVTCCYVPASASRISRHLWREIFRVTPVPSTKLPKYRGTFLSAFITRKGASID